MKGEQKFIHSAGRVRLASCRRFVHSSDWSGFEGKIERKAVCEVSVPDCKSQARHRKQKSQIRWNICKKISHLSTQQDEPDSSLFVGMTKSTTWRTKVEREYREMKNWQPNQSLVLNAHHRATICTTRLTPRVTILPVGV